MNITLLSDTHALHDRLSVPAGDIFIFAGRHGMLQCNGTQYINCTIQGPDNTLRAPLSLDFNTGTLRLPDNSSCFHQTAGQVV